MALRDPLDEREPRALALELVGAVEPLEETEELAGIRHLEADAVVLHRDPVLALGAHRADPDTRPRAAAGELHRIGEQVLDRRPGQRRVALEGGQRLDHPVDDPVAGLGLQPAHHVLGQQVEVHRAAQHVLPAEAAELHQVVEHGAESARALGDPCGVVPHVGIQGGARVLEQELGEPADVPDRGAQVVGDAVQQGVQLGGGRAERRAALPDPALELGALLGQVVAQVGVLDGDRERRGDLERDVAVLRVERADRLRRQAHLADRLAVHQERDRQQGPEPLLGELPEDRRRRLDRGDVLDVAHRASAEHLAGGEAVQRDGGGGQGAAIGEPRHRQRLRPGEVEEDDGAAPAGHHPADAAQRGPPDLRGRAGGEDRLPHVVQDREPLGGAAKALLGALALGDVGDHPDGADQPPLPAHDGAGRHQAPELPAVAAQEPEVPALPARRRRAGERPLGARPGGRVDEVVDPAAQHRAVLIAQELGHARIDVGDDPVVVRHPDAFLRHVHQLLEPLLALLERAGPLLQPELPALVRGGVAQRRSHEPAEEPERLGVAVAEGVGPGGDHLEDAEGALLVGERDGEQGADADGAVTVVGHPGIRQDVVGALQLAGADAEPRQAVGHPEPGRVGPDVHLGDQLVALDGLDHRAARPGEPEPPVGDHPHHRAGVEPRGGDRLLHLDHRLEQLGVEPHGLLGQLALGDVELGAEIADLASGLVPERLPGAGGPALLSPAGHHAVLLVPERAALREALPLGRQRGAVVGVDVLEELLVPEVLLGIPGEPLEGGVHEAEPQVHVVRDDALAHGGRHRVQVPPGFRRGPLGAPALRPLDDECHQQGERQRAQGGGRGRERLGRDAVDQTSERCVHVAWSSAEGLAPRAWRTFRRKRSRENGFSRNAMSGSSMR